MIPYDTLLFCLQWNYQFPRVSFAKQQVATITEYARDFRFGNQTANGMQNRSGCTRSIGASRAVHDCSQNQRKQNDALQIQCFGHPLLLRKESSCGPGPIRRLHKMPDNADAKDLMVSSTANFSSTKKRICLFISFPPQKPSDEIMLL